METQTLFTPALPTFFSVFVVVYLFGYLVVFRNWGPKHLAEASSCLISLAHGTPAVFMAIYALTTNTTTKAFSSSSSSMLVSPNTSAQNSVLEYSMAYFLLDLMHYVAFFPSDVLFILHHLATLYVFATCRYAVGHGAVSLLVLLVLAEATSACQNAWALAGFRRADSPAASRLYEFLCPRFYALYCVFRAVLGPLFVLKIGFVFASGVADDVIPRWAWISWMVVITSAVLVSVLWVSVHWIEWFEQRRIKALKKMV